jgi:hypothetical protein
MHNETTCSVHFGKVGVVYLLVGLKRTCFLNIIKKYPFANKWGYLLSRLFIYCVSSITEEEFLKYNYPPHRVYSVDESRNKIVDVIYISGARKQIGKTVHQNIAHKTSNGVHCSFLSLHAALL